MREHDETKKHKLTTFFSVLVFTASGLMTAVRGGGGTGDDSKMRPLAVSIAASGRTTAVLGGGGTCDDSKTRPLAVPIVLQSSLRTATGASSSDCRRIASLSLPIATAIGAGGGGGCCSSGKNNHLLII